jgi:hypothetical protein
MSNIPIDPTDSKVKRGLSIRLDPEPLDAYGDCVAAAGLNVTGSLRNAVLSTLRIYRQLEANGLRTTCKFTRKKKDDVDHFPELLGSVTVDVTPPSDLKVENLNRLVFVIPEFVFEKSHEPFRIDSAHTQRVVNNGREISSDMVTRNVLSFRLINGVWRASIFDYNSGIDATEIELRCEDAVKKTIAATVACFLTHQLPETRILTADEVVELNETFMQNPHTR